MKRRWPDPVTWDDVVLACECTLADDDDPEQEESLARKLERSARCAESRWRRSVSIRTAEARCIVAKLTLDQLKCVDKILEELGDDFDAYMNDTTEECHLFKSKKKKQRKEKTEKPRPQLLVCDCGGFCGECALVCRLRRWAYRTLTKQTSFAFMLNMPGILFCENERHVVFGVEHTRDIRFAPMKRQTEIK